MQFGPMVVGGSAGSGRGGPSYNGLRPPFLQEAALPADGCGAGSGLGGFAGSGRGGPSYSGLRLLFL
ncbi:MAG: hypothetical protein CVV18_09245 [Gammaproteobacteria bacterium HGW-Gammaproteobacteria-8]|nr:MAG: hypothetical protein CVV18_09245 [Gammaproteobacteria bacterium HGW-Gammaproteobacteria-8]